MTVEIRKPKIGDTIAQYTIRSKLGSGGMGDVYLCDDAALGRQVAVKIMHSYDQSDTDIISRFILEGKALAKLTHPNIVSVFGLGEDKGFLYIAMEHVSGRSLFQLSRERRLTIREMISIFSDIAAGLDHAHSHGIVHRDIKPANILVDTNGRAKIIDFGIAKMIGGNPAGAEGIKTKTGAVIGTLNYIAPELFRGVDPSPSSDIYALGLLFAEMLTGRTPFKGESQFATMELIRGGKIDIPENLQIVLPQQTWTALYKIIDKEPENRPASASAAAQLLKAIEFPNLPSYFNSELVSVRIENVEELQDQLEAANVDPAEWQFVLSLAVRTHATRGAEQANDANNDETTRLIERTGLHIPGEILEASIENYRRDLDTIMTMRRAESLSSLAPPPPVAQITPHTRSVDVQPIGTPTPTGGFTPTPGPNPAAASSGGGGKWVAAIAIALFIGGGVYYQQQKLKSDAAAAAQAASETQRRRGAAVDAPPTTTVPAGAPAPQASSGFAMVVEPATDAWPPVAWVEPPVGDVSTWKWKVRSTSGGDTTYIERRTFEGPDEGLQKFKVERLKRSPAGVIAEAAGTEWYLPGFPALPRKTLQSLLFGSVGGSAVGQPGAVFPLRKGKEVQFELSFKSTEPVSWTPLVQLSGGFSTNYRSACSVRDKVKLTLASGQQELVKIDCYTKSDTGEISDVLYWNVEKNTALRHDRRVNSTSGGTVSEVSMSGERVENVANVQPAVRNPAQNK